MTHRNALAACSEIEFFYETRTPSTSASTTAEERGKKGNGMAGQRVKDDVKEVEGEGHGCCFGV